MNKIFISASDWTEEEGRSCHCWTILTVEGVVEFTAATPPWEPEFGDKTEWWVPELLDELDDEFIKLIEEWEKGGRKGMQYTPALGGYKEHLRVFRVNPDWSSLNSMLEFRDKYEGCFHPSTGMPIHWHQRGRHTGGDSDGGWYPTGRQSSSGRWVVEEEWLADVTGTPVEKSTKNDHGCEYRGYVTHTADGLEWEFPHTSHVRGYNGWLPVEENRQVPKEGDFLTAEQAEAEEAKRLGREKKAVAKAAKAAPPTTPADMSALEALAQKFKR